MENYIIAAIIIAIVGLAIFYVVKSKKSGKKCIGCPDSGSSNCSCSKSGGCSCCQSDEK